MMENNNKHNIRLYKLIKNGKTVYNLLTIYKALRGKENTEKRLFLKTLVYCAMNRPKDTALSRYIKPEDYFGVGGYYCFDMPKLVTLFMDFKKHNIAKFYGQCPNDEFGKLV